jgi:hypothetical protein
MIVIALSSDNLGELMSERGFVLNFVSDEKVELFETAFRHPLVGEERRATRGKDSGAYRSHSTFQWTRAVQAMSLLMVRAALSNYFPRTEPLLMGFRGSLASSLDYAIDKQTLWLVDMFGTTATGEGMARRVFKRSNPGQRSAAPVAISLHPHTLACSEILILQNYVPVRSEPALRALCNGLEVGLDTRDLGESVGGSQVMTPQSDEVRW